MAQDIIADSQTERTIDALMRGDADAKSQQVALASVLMALTKQADELREIRESLWNRNDIERLVDERHKYQCDNCPAKMYAKRLANDEAKGHEQKKTLIEHLLSPTVMIFILSVLALLTAMYVILGREGYADVTNTAKDAAKGFSRSERNEKPVHTTDTAHRWWMCVIPYGRAA